MIVELTGRNESFPCLFMNDVINSCRANPIFLRYFNTISILIIISYPIDIFHHKFCHWVIFALNVSPLFNLIRFIVFKSSHPEVTWFDTSSVIAMMKNMHAFWNFTSMNNPRIPMRPKIFFINCYCSISRSIFPFCPIPAMLSFFYAFKKSFFEIIKGFQVALSTNIPRAI